jgi:hypothetical protein
MESDTIDITDRVETYASGKTFECDCGQDIGVPMDERYIKCASCGEMLEDTKAAGREPPKSSESQMTLSSFS